MPRHPYLLAGGAALVLFAAGACRSSSPRSGSPDVRPVTATMRTGAPALLAQQLLEADRSYAKDAATRPFPGALAPMFAPDVRMPHRDQVLVGRSAVLAAFSTLPDTGGTVGWTPVRVGISADGQHGFTAGVQHVTRRDGSRSAARYLAYWVRGTDQRWHVVAWRRRPLGSITPDTTVMSAVLPGEMMVQGNDESQAAHYRGLIAAEQGFSDEANRIGVGAAFAQLGDDQAINMGRPDDAAFVRGPAAIAALVAGGQPLDAPSAIVWNADTAIVAASGDLGITFGIIRPKQAPASGAGGAAFFTIWRKSSRTAPWRYVAE